MKINPTLIDWYESRGADTSATQLKLVCKGCGFTMGEHIRAALTKVMGVTTEVAMICPNSVFQKEVKAVRLQR